MLIKDSYAVIYDQNTRAAEYVKFLTFLQNFALNSFRFKPKTLYKFIIKCTEKELSIIFYSNNVHRLDDVMFMKNYNPDIIFDGCNFFFL